MDISAKEKTLENLTKAQSILIAVSQNSGFDGLAAGLALYLSCQKLGKNVSIFAKSPTVGEAKKLYAIDKIGKPQGKKNLVVVVDDAVENVDKVTYYLEGDQLKIVIHPLPNSQGVSKEQISYEDTFVKPDLLFAIGFSSFNEFAKEVTQEQNLDSGTWIVAVNKDAPGQKFAQVDVFNPQAASFGEITGQLFRDLALPVDEDIAFNVYSAIAKATDNFSISKVTPQSFQIAAWLMEFGAGKASLAGISDGSSQSSAQAANKLMTDEKQPSVRNSSPFDWGRFNPPIMPKPPVIEETPDVIPSFDQTPIEQVETEKHQSEKDWLKPPKVYKGSKSFDKEG